MLFGGRLRPVKDVSLVLNNVVLVFSTLPIHRHKGRFDMRDAFAMVLVVITEVCHCLAFVDH